ncbi:MAG: hypothetical protein OXO53_05260, partial [Chloroflexota bacterium]|nr:hypothetical protein [Chloroflexota bacterium]
MAERPRGGPAEPGLSSTLLLMFAMALALLAGCSGPADAPPRTPHVIIPRATPTPTAAQTAAPPASGMPTPTAAHAAVPPAPGTPTPTAAQTAVPPAPGTPTPTAAHTAVPPAPGTPTATVADPFAKWNELAPQHWWRDSEPYTCLAPPKDTSPWIEAGMTDLGGSDALSLIRFFGNGSYLRYGFMGFEGCTPVKKYLGEPGPVTTHLDAPVDPTYYSLGDLDITVDIARVPPDAPGWYEDDRMRETMTMAEAVGILNAHVAPYYEKISEGKLRMRFHAGNDFALEGEGSPDDVFGQKLRLAGVMDCRGDAAENYPCNQGAPGALNRLLLTDVTTDRGGDAYNGDARMGLVSLREANMETLVHEIGHSWMGWPHSYAELLWYPDASQANGEADLPNPYSNILD